MGCTIPGLLSEDIICYTCLLYTSIRTVCFVSPVFTGITDFEAIFERVKDQCDLFWLENLNLRGGFKKTVMDYIAGQSPDLVPLYDEIYNKHNRSYFEALEVKAEEMSKKYDCALSLIHI